MTTEATDPVWTFDGPDGINIEIFDKSTQYAYANIYWVRLMVVASFPGCEESFERALEKMGVFEEDLEATKRGLIEEFEKSTMPYLFKTGFADKLDVVKKAEKAAKKSVGVGGYRS